MAYNSDFVQYIVDQCFGAGEIDIRKIMGDIDLLSRHLLRSYLRQRPLHQEYVTRPYHPERNNPSATKRRSKRLVLYQGCH